MTNHPGIRAAVIAAAGTLALMVAACDAGATTASGGQSGPSASTPPSAAAGEGNTGTGTGTDTGGTGNGGGTATKSPTPKATTAKASPSAASGPQIEYFKVSGNASCDEQGPGFSAPGTVTLTWKVTGATKVALSIDDPSFFSAHGTGSFDDYPATTTQTIPFACNVPTGHTATHQYTLDTIDGGLHKSITIEASAVNHA